MGAPAATPVDRRLGGGDPPSAELPALLLPVRIEARFESEGDTPELWVRVFPDQIAIDSHDPRLTDAELSAGRRYWEALWRAGTTDVAAAKGAWASLAQRVGAARAAYLVHSPLLTPFNLGARPSAPTPDGSPLVPPPDFPAVGPDDRRVAAWAGAPRARALPDRWTVTLIRGGAVVGRAVSSPIPDDLAVGPDPSLPRSPTADGLPIDEGILWMVDFDAAVEAGMGIRIPITPEDAASGFDRVLIHGLTGAAPQDGPGLVAGIIDSHRFTDGLAFVPQGTPTNNTADAAAGYTRADPGYEQSFAREVADVPQPHDGEIFAQALGLELQTVERLGAAARTDQANADAMTLALWPATLGYFLEQALGEVVDQAEREQLRAYVLASVRARGTIPAVRVGQTPYGVLPVTSLARYIPRPRRPLVARVVDGLRRLWPVWQASVPLAPHIDRGGDPDAALVGILGMDASARAYRVRHVLGEELLRHVESWLEIGAAGAPDFVSAPGTAALARLGYGFEPRLVRLALTKIDHRVPFPIVDDKPVSETEGLPAVPLPDGTTGNYISWLRHAPLQALRDDVRSFPGGTPPGALLYKVLRQALLVEWSHVTWRILIDTGAVAAIARERELVGFAGDRELDRPTVWQALARPYPGQTGAVQQTIASHIAEAVALRLPDYRRLWELQDAFEVLAGLPTAELERLFTETLDTYSHRLDPWVTSLAVELERSGRGDGGRAYHVGAFGWIEDLRPSQAPPEVEGSLAKRVEQVDELRRARSPAAPTLRPARSPRRDNAGFVHAPSLGQAEVGAVLRSGYLTHRDSSDGSLLAVDVSSDRTRVALDLLEGIRQGQPLTALLGYRFERALTGASLQVLVQPFRDAFPLVANRLTTPEGPVEAVAAANVVDGVALHDAWKSGALWPGTFGADSAQQSQVDGFIADIDDALDALGDLSIAESVYQIIRGNLTKAGGLIDAVSRGERPPDPEFVATPRSGIDLTHRVAVLFTPGPAREQGWPGAAHPRAQAEPRLDAWVSHLLPDPGDVRCAVRYRRPAAPAGELALTLVDLDLGPLDVLAVAAAGGDEQVAELEQRVAYAARVALPPDVTDLELVFERDPGWSAQDRSFPELLVVARAVYELLAGARALQPRDLYLPEKSALDDGAVLDNTELDGRSAAAIARIGADAVALDNATTAPAFRSALEAGSLYGAGGGVPVSAVGGDPATADALRAQAVPLAAELHKRHDAATALDGSFDRASASPEQLRDHLLALLSAIFGDGFTVCPQFTPPAAGDLGDAFAASAAILAGDKDAPERWLGQLAPVRAGIGRLEALRSTVQLAAGRYPPTLDLAQLPLRAPDRWVALEFVPGGSRPASGTVSIAAEILPAHDPSEPHSGLLVDEWPERIPATVQSTGLAFHFDRPSARAPQSLLFAFCPDERASWDDETLEAILGETLDLAKARTVDLESLTELGQLLPALLFPLNLEGDTVAVSFEAIR